MSDIPQIEVENLWAYARSEEGPKAILQGVSLEVRRGECVGIVGETGAGKSMLARSMLRLLPRGITTSGRICFDGVAGDEQWIRDRAAVIFQDPMTALNPVVRVGRQITEAMRGKGLSKEEMERRVVEFLQTVGISEPSRGLQSYPHQLSGGMRQRVCIAIALAREPAILVADEPTTALDVTIQRQILELLQRLQSEREMTVLLITHDLGVVATLTNRVVVMYDGRIVERASTTDLFAHARHPYTAALMAAMPRLDRTGALPSSEARELRTPGVVGCPYAPHCAWAQDDCRSETPDLRSMGVSGHEAACFHPLALAEGAVGVGSQGT